MCLLGLSFRNIEIFASTVSACVDRFLDVDMIIDSNYSIQQFIPVKKSDLTMDDDKISFTTTVSAPSLYVVGVPSSIVGVAPTPPPAVPLRCVISMDYSDDLNDYLRGDYIEVKISMDLRREEVNQVLLVLLQYMRLCYMYMYMVH